MFCASQQKCEAAARLVAEFLHADAAWLRSHGGSKCFDPGSDKGVLSATRAVLAKRVSTQERTVTAGVAYYHAGVSQEERSILDTAFSSGTLCVMCATSSLAVGVNLPARRVIFRTPFIGIDFLTPAKYR